jgi:hypothetical protein
MEEGATPEEWVMDRIISGLYHGCILASNSPRSRILHKQIATPRIIAWSDQLIVMPPNLI